MLYCDCLRMWFEPALCCCVGLLVLLLLWLFRTWRLLLLLLQVLLLLLRVLRPFSVVIQEVLHVSRIWVTGSDFFIYSSNSFWSMSHPKAVHHAPTSRMIASEASKCVATPV